jgi:D-sedoheptulose 7-phosphate isomerase
MSEHVSEFFAGVGETAKRIDVGKIGQLVEELVRLRSRGGRLFLIGVGGSAANASHAASDFRKLCGIEAYAPTDNVAELTARANDEGWNSVFSEWLKVSHFGHKDALFVLSVGGGTPSISANIAEAIWFAKRRSARVLGVVGRSDGAAAREGDVVVVVPEYAPCWVTPLSEAFQAVIWHCIVSHPALQLAQTKW